MADKFIKFLFTEVWVPFVLYKGLPWACFCVTIITFSTPNVPNIVRWAAGILSLYAIIILAFRFFTSKGY